MTETGINTSNPLHGLRKPGAVGPPLAGVELPPVAESAVFGVPHANFGEAVVAAVIARDAAGFDEGAAIRSLRTKLAGYKLPKRIIVVVELPRNSMGKVQNNRLREDFAAVFQDANRVC